MTPTIYKEQSSAAASDCGAFILDPNEIFIQDLAQTDIARNKTLKVNGTYDFVEQLGKHELNTILQCQRQLTDAILNE